jgi:hypothetical protein
MASLDATERRPAPSPHSSPRSPHAHVDSPRSPLPHGHRQLAADALQTTPTTTTVRHRAQVHGDDADAPVLHFQRQEACRVRGDIANTAEPSPMTLAHRSHPNTVDLPRTPRPRPPAIKGGRPCLNFPHHLAPLPLLNLLDLFPSPITPHLAGISPESAASATRRSQRFRAPPELPRPPSAPPSSATPPQRLAEPRRSSGEPPTPYCRRR